MKYETIDDKQIEDIMAGREPRPGGLGQRGRLRRFRAGLR